MKLGRLNHIGIATSSIADSIVSYRDLMTVTLAPLTPKHYNDLVMCRS